MVHRVKLIYRLLTVSFRPQT